MTNEPYALRDLIPIRVAKPGYDLLEAEAPGNTTWNQVPGFKLSPTLAITRYPDTILRVTHSPSGRHIEGILVRCDDYPSVEAAVYTLLGAIARHLLPLKWPTSKLVRTFTKREPFHGAIVACARELALLQRLAP